MQPSLVQQQHYHQHHHLLHQQQQRLHATRRRQHVVRAAAAASHDHHLLDQQQQHRPRATRRRQHVVRAAAAASQAAEAAPPPPPLPSAVTAALKEWAVMNAALADGGATFLVRKGGLREPTFAPKARAFWMFPTAFHVEERLLQPGAARRYAAALALDPKRPPPAGIPLHPLAVVTGAWATKDARRLLDGVAPLQRAVSAGYFDARLKWRQQEPLTLLELRAYVPPPAGGKAAQQPAVSLQPRDELFGCFSWLELSPEDVAAAAGQQLAPALSDEEFAERQRQLRAALDGLDGVAELALPAL